jgi:hypothetical protein
MKKTVPIIVFQVNALNVLLLELSSILENMSFDFRIQDKYLVSLFKHLFEIKKPLDLTLNLSNQLISQEMLIDLVSKIENSEYIFLKTLNLKNVETQTKESLYTIASLIHKQKIEEINLTGLESDDEFVTELIGALETDPLNPLQYLSLGQISSFGFEYIANNIDFLGKIKNLEFKESPHDPFPEENKEMFLTNLVKYQKNLIFCNMTFVNPEDPYFERLIEFNEMVRKQCLEKKEEHLIQQKYTNHVLADISKFEENRLPLSFSEKNYLESVFGDKLEKSIFEIKNLQEKSRKQQQKLLMKCTDEPLFEVDENIFISDGFALLLCRKMIEKFGLEVPEESQKEQETN